MSLLTSFTRPGAGGSQPDVIPIALWASMLGTAGSGAWPTANRAIFLKHRFDKATRATGVMLAIGAPAQNAKVGLYSSDGTTLTQLAMSVGTAISATNDWQTISFATSTPVGAYVDYYVFVAVDATATLALLRTSIVSAQSLVGRNGYALNSAYASPPSTQTIAGMTGGTNTVPSIMLVTTG